MRLAIKDFVYQLPQHQESNQDLATENPAWDLERIKGRSGVEQRHIADSNETALDLAFAACNKLMQKNSILHDLIDGILFCTQSPDYIMPPNSCVLHKMLDLGDEICAFDFNLACSGYVYGLAISQGLLQTGMAKNILLVTADTYSKYIHKQDRSARVLFGDGAAVTWLTTSETGAGLLDIICATQGKNHDKFIIPAGACRMPKSPRTGEEISDENGNVRTLENIHMDGMGIMEFVLAKVPPQIRSLLTRNNLQVGDVDLFVFHQASKLVLDSLARVLRIPPDKVFQNIPMIGNTVSASIPIALCDASAQGILQPGHKVLISGFGVGLSWGSALIQF